MLNHNLVNKITRTLLYSGTIKAGTNYQVNTDGKQGLLYIKNSTSNVSRHEVYLVLTENIYSSDETSLLISGLSATKAGVTTNFSNVSNARTLTINNGLAIDIPVSIYFYSLT